MLSVVFFLTILLVNVDSQFGLFETTTNAFTDLFPSLRRYNVLFSVILAGILCILGLPLCTNAGMYIFQICDWYLYLITFAMVDILEIIIVAYIYGMDRFCSDIALMFGSGPNKIIQWFWKTITPLSITVHCFCQNSMLKHLINHDCQLLGIAFCSISNRGYNLRLPWHLQISSMGRRFGLDSWNTFSLTDSYFFNFHHFEKSILKSPIDI